MNEQLIERQSEQVWMVEVSDEALEAAADNELAGPLPTYATPFCG